MDFWGWILLIIVVGVGMGIAQVVAVSNKQKAMEEQLESLPDFSPTQKVMGSDGNTGIAVDENNKKIALINNGVNGVTLRTIIYQDLLSSEIFVDGETVTKTVRGSQLGGALIGGLALGGIGAVIGGLSGKTTSSDKVKKIDLRITVNDTKSPLHDINFMDIERKKDSIIYEMAIEQARHWHGLVAILIRKADNDDAHQVDKVSSIDVNNNLTSLADELSKLSALRDKGVLTEDEFSIQKYKLLS